MNAQILYFKSSSLAHLDYLKKTSIAFESVNPKKNCTIILCASYAHTDKELIDLGFAAVKWSQKRTVAALQKIINKHILAIQNIMRWEKHTQTISQNSISYNDALAFFEKKILTIQNDISALLHGISFIKEVSKRTQALLASYASNLGVILIQANIYCKLGTMLTRVAYERTSKALNFVKHQHYIIPLQSHAYNLDIEISQLAYTNKVQALNIWSSEEGVMSANPRLVSEAFHLSHIDFSMALETGYLGGKIFHPSAIQMFKEKNIPIFLYSVHAPSKVASVVKKISNKEQKKDSLNITERDKMSVLTIRSTKMFDTHGYLEQIFKIFSDFAVPVETLSTSEISVTLTYPSKYDSENFQKSLRMLGDTSVLIHQTIVSIVGETLGRKTAIIGKVLICLNGYAINMISLGYAGTNFNIVFDTKLKREIIPKIHKSLFQ